MSNVSRPAGAVVVVDGYNVLLRAGRGAGESARAELVRQAVRYQAGRAIEIVIVFDSRQGGGERAAAAPGVRVEFARGDADSHILELVRRARSPRSVLVLSSDRRLCEQARDLGARTASADDFERRAASTPACSPGPSEPRLGPDEVSRWLEELTAPRPAEDWPEEPPAPFRSWRR